MKSRYYIIGFDDGINGFPPDQPDEDSEVAISEYNAGHQAGRRARKERGEQ